MHQLATGQVPAAASALGQVTLPARDSLRVGHNRVPTDSAGSAAIGQRCIHDQHGQYFAQSPQLLAEYAVAGVGKPCCFSMTRLATVLRVKAGKGRSVVTSLTAAK